MLCNILLKNIVHPFREDDAAVHAVTFFFLSSGTGGTVTDPRAETAAVAETNRSPYKLLVSRCSMQSRPAEMTGSVELFSTESKKKKNSFCGRLVESTTSLSLPLMGRRGFKVSNELLMRKYLTFFSFLSMIACLTGAAG